MILIFPEDLGGDTETGPTSLWMMQELQMLEGLYDARRGAGFSCQLGDADHKRLLPILSNLASCYNACEVRTKFAPWLPKSSQEPKVRQHVAFGSEGFRVLWHGSHPSPLSLH